MRPTATGSRSETILRCATTLFRRYGFNGVSIDQIADAAGGLTGPAVYRHFADKQSLLAATILSFLADTEREVATAKPDDGDDAVLRACLRASDALAVYFHESRFLDLDIHARRRKSVADIRSALWTPLGIVPDDPSLGLRARALGGAVIHVGLARRPRSLGQRLRLAHEIADAIAQCVLEYDVADTNGPADPHPIGVRHVSPRERILSVTSQLMRTYSFEGLSLQQIGDAAGLAPSAVGRYFNAKEQILYEVMSRSGEAMALNLSSALSRARTSQEALYEVARKYVDLVTESRHTVLVMAREMQALSPSHKEIRIRQQRMQLTEVAHLIAVTSPGMAQSEAALRAGAMFGLINGVMSDGHFAARPNIATDLRQLALAVAIPTTTGARP